jgi:hypothetical protein
MVVNLTVAYKSPKQTRRGRRERLVAEPFEGQAPRSVCFVGLHSR